MDDETTVVRLLSVGYSFPLLASRKNCELLDHLWVKSVVLSFSDEESNALIPKNIGLQLKTVSVSIVDLQCLQFYRTFMWSAEFVVFTLVSCSFRGTYPFLHITVLFCK